MMLSPAVILLAGGEGRRMGPHVPKAGKAMTWLGEHSLMQHALERLAQNTQTSPVVALNVNTHLEVYAQFGLPVIADTLTGFQGPLAGILAGMEWAAAQGHDSIITLAADTPFFPLTFIKELCSGSGSVSGKTEIRLAASHSLSNLQGSEPPAKPRIHPTFGLWPVSLRGNLRAALLRGERKVSLWANNQGANTALFPRHRLTPSGELIDPFFNINTPADLHTAEQLICGG